MKGYVVRWVSRNGMRGTFTAYTYANAVKVWSRFESAEIWFGETKLR